LGQVSVDQPILLPYQEMAGALDGVWSTAPSWAAMNRAFGEALEEARATSPYVVVEAGLETPSLTAAISEVMAEETVGRVIEAIESGTADSLVVVASAYRQARLISAVQSGLGVGQIPILSTPSARTPLFARTLFADGPIASTLVTVGPNTSDLAALARGPTGSYSGAFYAALRLAANDPTCLNIFGDAPLSITAQTADVASHDATVALLRAIERADSAAPLAVRKALEGQVVKSDDGLAGPELVFTNGSALPDNAVVPLYASTQNPGVRPPMTNAAPMLVWFPLV